MTREELEKRYSTLSIDELFEIIDHKFGYTELAVMIAIEEMGRRKISEEDILKYKEDQIQEINKLIERNIVDDLSVLQKNLFYFLWVPILTFPFKRNFREDGYVLKLKQANYYSLFGFLFFMLTGFISGVYRLSFLTSLAILILTFLPVYAFDEYFNRQRLKERLFKSFKEQDEIE